MRRLGYTVGADRLISCGAADYKGTRAPACNKGVGCIECWRTRAAYFKDSLDRC